MERLTIKPGICAMASTDFCESMEDCYMCSHGKEMRFRLSAYEDTGMNPEEIKKMKASANLAFAKVDHYESRGLTMQRIEELAKAEKEGCPYCNDRKELETDGGGELEVVEIQPLPAINLTTGQKDEAAFPPFMALWFRAFDGEFEDFVPIRCCPMCGRVLKARDKQ